MKPTLRHHLHLLPPPPTIIYHTPRYVPAAAFVDPPSSSSISPPPLCRPIYPRSSSFIHPIKMFKYVFIPANDSKPIELRKGDKSGGLSDDILSKSAKDYFYASSDKGARAAALASATPEQRVVLANQLREEVKAASATSPYASQMAALDDDALINIMSTTHTSATCEITALTVPTRVNQQRAVSMYSADDARTQQLPYNRRATELLVACGHSITNVPSPSTMSIGAAPPGGICGDAFVGRCHDDEVADIWERVDFTLDDANPRAEWCDVARQPGGGGSAGGSSGGGGGGGGPRSLSGLMNQNAAIGAGGGVVGNEGTGF
ncbi:hypothetical protein ACHAXR_001366, partial [Thalassiosira sp. AJA248-18]